MSPSDRLKKLLQENFLTISLAPQKIKKVDDGSIIIEPQVLIVNDVPRPKPEPKEELVEEGVNES